jgi:hypothetical protein
MRLRRRRVRILLPALPALGEAGLVRAFPQGPLVHYIHYGWREGRDPSAGFSGEGYLKANPDVRESGCNPLVHFVESGLAEWTSGPCGNARTSGYQYR